MNWKRMWKWSWPNLRYSAGIFLEMMRKIKKKLGIFDVRANTQIGHLSNTSQK
jgi:hypothetical protein